MGLAVGATAQLIMLVVTPSLTIPESELTERFVRAAGPGGQHVNRTESAVELRFDVASSPSLPEAARQRLLARHDRRLNSDGVLVIQARRFRDQARNREDARARLATVLAAALAPPPPPRRKTRPTKAAMARRRDSRQQRARVKQSRKPPGREE